MLPPSRPLPANGSGVLLNQASRLISGTDAVGVRVLLVGTGAYPIPPPGYGAVERILSEYADALRRAGHSVQIVNEVHGSSSFGEYRFALHLPAILRRQDYDVVHASTPVVANRLAASGLPFIYTSHSRHWFWRASWRHRWGFWLERRAVRRATATVALTSTVEAAMRLAVPPGWVRPLRVIPYGVSPDDFAPDWGRRTGRNALGVGIIAPLKRWEVAAAALKGTGMTLRIAGPISDAPYARRIQSAGESVELLGEVDDTRLRRLYAEADLLVHPSLVEVLPRAVLEGMAAGLPVIGSSVVGSLFHNRPAGFAAPAGATGEDLVRFVRDSALQLAGDGNLRRRMGDAAGKLVRDEYSWDRVVSAHLELYRESGVPVA